VSLLEKMNIGMRGWSLPILDTATDRLKQQESLQSGMHAGLSVSREWWVDEYQHTGKKKKKTLLRRIIQNNKIARKQLIYVL